MGYRSEIAIAIIKKDYEKLIEKTKEIQDEIVRREATRLLGLYGSSPTVNRKFIEDKYIILHYPSIKWYDWEYKEIKWIMENLPKPHIFIEIGEDLNDNTEDYCIEDENGNETDMPYNLIYIDRKIEFKD